MPQMSPLNWVSLFLFFSLIFILINTNNFFFVNYNPLTTKSTKISIKNNWKW